jgi:hypothetical protein
MEDQIHGSLICGTSILQAKGHHYPLEQPHKPRTSESRLAHIFLSHENLVITSIAIKETDHFVA